jgi:hypothetical protein
VGRALRLVCGGLLVAAVVGFAGGPASGDGNQELDLAVRTNNFRQANGLPPLYVDERIAAVARNWVVRMASYGRLVHNPNLRDELPAGAFAWAENLGNGSDTATIHRGLENSPSHRANLLNPDLTHMGIAVIYANGYVWAVEDFAGYENNDPPVTAPPTTEPPPPPRPPRTVAAVGRAGTFTFSVPGGGSRATPPPPAPPTVDVAAPRLAWANVASSPPAAVWPAAPPARAVKTAAPLSAQGVTVRRPRNFVPSVIVLVLGAALVVRQARRRAT